MNKIIEKDIKKGFTLLEILLVIAAIGILAGIVIVAINPLRQIGKVRQAERASEINQLNKAIEQYYIAEGKYPDALTQVGFTEGTYREVCNTGKLDSNAILANEGVDCATDGLIDLRVLVPTYVAEIPKDSGLQFGIGENIFYKTANAAPQDRTGYLVGINTTNNKVSIVAKNSGLGNVVALNPMTLGVTIDSSGGTNEGDTLTANLTPAGFVLTEWEIVWYRVDTNGVEIEVGRGTTYPIQAGDVGQEIIAKIILGDVSVIAGVPVGSGVVVGSGGGGVVVQQEIIINPDGTIRPNITNPENYTCNYEILGNTSSQACNIGFNPNYDTVTTNIYDPLPDINIEIVETSNPSNITTKTHRAFITKWDGLEIAGYNGGFLDIRLYDEYEYDFIIRWGDDSLDPGNTQRITKNAGDSMTLTREYISPPPNTFISIVGNFPGLTYTSDYWDYSSYAWSRSKGALKGVEQWGTIEFKSFRYAFAGASAMEYISSTDIPRMSQVTDMEGMFISAILFNSNINNWNTSSVTNMSRVFASAEAFNQPIENWNTSSVTNMENMFNSATAFNQPIGSFDVSSVTDMSGMFGNALVFNQPIGNWNTASVTNMGGDGSFSYGGMFSNAKAFNQPIGNWNTSSVTNMRSMFDSAISFNQPIGNWNTASVTNMDGMFTYALVFNQSIGSWDVSNVTDMSSMFSNALAFNQPIGGWNTSSVTDMSWMFDYLWENLYVNGYPTDLTSFNQPIGNWNVSNVINMDGMFNGADNFTQDLSGWCVNNITNPWSFGAFNSIQPLWGTCPAP